MIVETQYSHLNNGIVERIRHVARDQSTEAPGKPAENESDRDEPASPEPVDPPDNESLPGDPSVTRPDY